MYRYFEQIIHQKGGCEQMAKKHNTDAQYH